MMNSILKNPAPHTEAGMHYNLDRFKELYNWVNSLQMDSVVATMHPNRYGLLYFNNPETDFRMELVGNQLCIHQCCGITKNGAIIGIFKEVTTSLDFDVSNLANDGIYDILVAVDSQHRQPIGKADDKEIPLRQPFSIPLYQLDVFLEGTKNCAEFSNALKIGQLRKEGNSVVLVDYIPASIHVGATDLLWQKFLKYQKIFDDLWKNLIHISQITSIEMDPDRVNLRQLVLQLGQFFAVEKKIFELRAQANPFELFNFCKDFAKVLYFHTNALQRRTELIELIRQNVHSYIGRSFDPQSFRDAIQEMLSTSYNHNDIAQNLDTVDQFLQVIYSSVFELLGQNNRIHPINMIEGGLRQEEQKKGESKPKTKTSFF